MRSGELRHLIKIEEPIETILDGEVTAKWKPFVVSWISAGEIWTYASPTTIIVPAGALLKYSKGNEIKLTQTTVKYFYIVDVADTLLTIDGTDYILADEEITDPFYSHIKTYGAILPLIGREYWSAKQINAKITGKVRIRYIPGINSKMRVKFGSRILEINAPINVEEKNKEIVLLFSEAV